MSILKRPRRPLRALAILIVVAAVSALGRFVWVNGVFSSVTPGSAGVCKQVAVLPGVQDMEAVGGTVFLSAQDGVYAMVAGARPVRLAGAPQDFHPRGIGLFATPDGKAVFLLAVNRQSTGRFSIDTFEVADPTTAPKLVAQGMVEGGLLTDAWDVAATSPTSFYVANGAVSKYAPIRWLQQWGVISGGAVLYFDGMRFKPVVDGLYGPRGLVISGNRLVVSGLLSRSLSSFAKEDITGNLSDEQDITLPAAPDMLSRDGAGDIWVAAHANLLNWHAAGAGKRTTSQVLRVGLETKTVQQVYGDTGGAISGASVALPMGNRLLIASALDGKLLDCGP